MRFYQKIPKALLAWIVFIVAVSYYLYEYIQRITPAVMVDELMKGFQVNAMMLGNLSAVYLYVYAIAQVPVGIVIDRCGPKKPLFYAALVCVAGSFIFSYTSDLSLAYVGRGLVGLGSAFGYLCCLKLVVNWFSKKSFGLMCGLINMVGMLGAVVGEILLSYFMRTTMWRNLIFNLSVVGIFVALFILFFIQDGPRGSSQHVVSKNNKINFSELKNSLKTVCLSRHVLFSAIFVGVMYATFNMIAALWGVPYLQRMYQVTKLVATEVNTLLFLGGIVGYFLFGCLTSLYSAHHKIIMMIAVIIAIIASLLACFFAPTIESAAVLFFILGVAAGSTTTATTVAKESMLLEISGLTMSVVNTFLVAIGALSQLLFGYILGRGQESVRDIMQYPVHNFTHAFLSLSCLYVVGLLAVFFIREGSHAQVSSK